MMDGFLVCIRPCREGVEVTQLCGGQVWMLCQSPPPGLVTDNFVIPAAV